MFKTGTTSTGRALSLLGYNVHSGPWWSEGMLADDWYKTPEEWPKYYDLIKEKTTHYTAFQDYPWMYCYDKCYEWYPDAKFILTTRDPDSLAASEKRFWIRNGASEANIPKAEVFKTRLVENEKRIHEFFSDKQHSLLVVNYENGDGWKELCEFLGHSVPNIPFPHLNRTK